MKKILLSILCCLYLSACGGTTASDDPPNLSGAPFTGEFTNNSGKDKANITFNITQDADGVLTGQVIINESLCLVSGLITSGSTISGFNVSIGVEQPEGRTLTYALTLNGNSLSGTYILTGHDECSADTGTGTVSVSR